MSVSSSIPPDIEVGLPPPFSNYVRLCQAGEVVLVELDKIDALVEALLNSRV